MNDVANFYDKFADYQRRVGVNLRHLRILEHLKKFGLQRDSRVLEIGCGIGSLTGIIAEWVRDGSVIGADISPGSIEQASKGLARLKNVRLVVSDMSDFPTDETFDVIVLPDVLEHIPPERHEDLWKLIGQLLRPGGFVLINIPNPAHLRWLINNRPDRLQIIDLPVETYEVARYAANVGLTIHHLETYSIFNHEADYRLFVIRRDTDHDSENPRSPKILWIQTLIAKVRRRLL